MRKWLVTLAKQCPGIARIADAQFTFLFSKTVPDRAYDSRGEAPAGTIRAV